MDKGITDLLSRIRWNVLGFKPDGKISVTVQDINTITQFVEAQEKRIEELQRIEMELRKGLDLAEERCRTLELQRYEVVCNERVNPDFDQDNMKVG